MNHPVLLLYMFPHSCWQPTDRLHICTVKFSHIDYGIRRVFAKRDNIKGKQGRFIIIWFYWNTDRQAIVSNWFIGLQLYEYFILKTLPYYQLLISFWTCIYVATSKIRWDFDNLLTKSISLFNSTFGISKKYFLYTLWTINNPWSEIASLVITLLYSCNFRFFFRGRRYGHFSFLIFLRFDCAKWDVGASITATAIKTIFYSLISYL
jgi:hypothetical protein